MTDPPRSGHAGPVSVRAGRDLTLHAKSVRRVPVAPAEAAVTFLGVWKVGAILLSMSVLYGDHGIEHRLSDSGREAAHHRPGECASL
jgi:hypothetical protein